MKKLLIIEDDANNMLLITRLMEATGHAVIPATTGKEGIRLAAQERPDAILLDICLPDLEGTEVLRRLLALDGPEKLAIIAMTSRAMAGDREKLLAEGCTGYIEKPYDPEVVIDKIERLLKGAG